MDVSFKRTLTNAEEWKDFLEGAGDDIRSLREEVTTYLEFDGFHDFDNVTWDAEIERIYHEVKGDN